MYIVYIKRIEKNGQLLYSHLRDLFINIMRQFVQHVHNYICYICFFFSSASSSFLFTIHSLPIFPSARAHTHRAANVSHTTLIHFIIMHSQVRSIKAVKRRGDRRDPAQEETLNSSESQERESRAKGATLDKPFPLLDYYTLSLLAHEKLLYIRTYMLLL